LSGIIGDYDIIISVKLTKVAIENTSVWLPEE